MEQDTFGTGEMDSDAPPIPRPMLLARGKSLPTPFFYRGSTLDTLLRLLHGSTQVHPYQ